ncbi:hypothetical protein FOR85_12285 [Psychrobacter sp. YGAH215]|uniref:hypothetical protein n=1 Tax=Psychrobacter sp. YGAH215 TaxID=2596826 RepID=UPI001186A2B1|nr:hypothetical protein [Psychrobacter sp. YGAH215]TSB21671.1 hypothetical protein FOR85_12285 [Psychrobacter sp. YGAH215]
MKLKTRKSIKTSIMAIIIVLILAACQQKPNCKLKGVVINEDIVGTTRNDILHKLGQPTNSDIEIKGFDEFAFTERNKEYAIVLRYEMKDSVYYVSSQKCIKVNPSLELFGYVIWH